MVNHKTSVALLAALVSFAAQAEAAPAPQVVTVYQTATQVVEPNGSIFDNWFGNPVSSSATVAAASTAPAAPAAPAPAATTAAAAASNDDSSNIDGTGSTLDQLLTSNLSKWLSYFGLGSKPAASASPSAPAYPQTTQVQAPPSSSSPAYTPPSSTYVPNTPTTSTTSSVPSSSPSGGSGADSSFAQSILQAHNQYRADHGVSPLTWNDAAYQYAQNNANSYDCSGVLTHTHGPYGENLAAGYSSGPASVTAWYDEGSSYDYSAANTYDHFTQVVWKGTTSVGCAYKDCRAENWGLYVVCEYDPPGNVIGENKANVLPPS